jgi:hypothetical protein
METNKKLLSACLVLIFCLTVLSAVGIVKLCFLSGAVSDLNYKCEQLERDVDILCSDLSSLHTELAKNFREANSLFESVEYTLVGVDSEAGTAACEFTIIPKLISQQTNLTLTIGNTTHSLLREGNVFTGTVEFPVFTEEIPCVAVTDEVGTQQQQLEEVDLYWACREWLPSMQYIGSETISTTKDWTQVGLNYEFVYKSEHTPVTFVKVTEIHRTNGEETVHRVVTDLILKDDTSDYAEYFSNCVVMKDSVVEVVLRAEDSLGYIHEMTTCCESSEDGWFEGGFGSALESIYTPDGRLLFGE